MFYYKGDSPLTGNRLWCNALAISVLCASLLRENSGWAGFLSHFPG